MADEPSLKRDHDSFSFDELETKLAQPFTVDAQYAQYLEPQASTETAAAAAVAVKQERAMSPVREDVSAGMSAVKMERGVSPAESTTSSLSEARSITPVPGMLDVGGAVGGGPPPAKKPKFTFEEKRLQNEIRDAEMAQEKARKEVERKRKEAEMAQEKARKEAERKRKEEEKLKVAAEKEEKKAAAEAARVAKAEQKRIKDEEKRAKEEEKLKAEEEKRKKEQKQKKLNSFFIKPDTGPAKKTSVGRRTLSPEPASLAPNVATPAVCSPSKEVLPYEKIFPEFYCYPDVTVAPFNRFERDEDASEVLQKLVDSYLLGDRSPDHVRSFDAMSISHLPRQRRRDAGAPIIPVREIMSDQPGNSSRPIDLTEAQHARRTGDRLRDVRVKYLKFQEDVRPPYCGTYTKMPINGIAKLARNPLRRDLPNTNYDYDSEAEWIEDEDAEDLGSEGEEDDVDAGDDADDMEGFLDDEGDDVLRSRGPVVHGDLIPISTGLCWEDKHKQNTNVKMMAYRMEVILDPQLKSIDPLSTAYWAPLKSTTMEPPRIPLDILKPSSSTMNTAKAVKPFFPLTSALDIMKAASTTPTTKGSSDKTKKLLPESDMLAFNEKVRGSNLSKVGLIEVLKKEFPERTGAMIKGTLETVARREGKKEVDKRWVLVAERTA